MNRSKMAVSLVAVGISALFLVPPADAQGPRARYRSPTPTLSPWLNLYRRDVGPIDNYNTLVRPELDLRDTLRDQQNRLQQQGTGLRSLGQQMTAIERGEAIRPTGAASVFMSYSHYYSMGNPAAMGNRQAAAARSWAPARSSAGTASYTSGYSSAGRSRSLGR